MAQDCLLCFSTPAIRLLDQPQQRHHDAERSAIMPRAVSTRQHASTGGAYVQYAPASERVSAAWPTLNPSIQCDGVTVSRGRKTRMKPSTRARPRPVGGGSRPTAGAAAGPEASTLASAGACRPRDRGAWCQCDAGRRTAAAAGAVCLHARVRRRCALDEPAREETACWQQNEGDGSR